MTAYYIAQHDTDESAFAEYLRAAMPLIVKHGGRYLTKAGSHEMLEGRRPSRVVIVEFPDQAAIEAWYRDPDYRLLIPKRQAAATSTMIAIEGG